jgi:predicted XRE-type DNA-binding protein
MKKKPGAKQQRRSTRSQASRRRRAGQLPIGASPAAPLSHVTASAANVFSDLGFPPEQAENLKVRSDLMSEVQRLVDGMTQLQAADVLGVSQPRISELRRGHIERFTIDALVNMLAHGGVRIRISLRRKRVTAA